MKIVRGALRGLHVSRRKLLAVAIAQAGLSVVSVACGTAVPRPTTTTESTPAAPAKAGVAATAPPDTPAAAPVTPTLVPPPTAQVAETSRPTAVLAVIKQGGSVVQKWEYLTVQVGFSGTSTASEPNVTAQNGKSVPAGTTRDAYFGQLGDQGWELAGVVSAGGFSLSDYTFKRPKP